MFRIINVRHHKAKKDYKYYDGRIISGQYYYRGFAVTKANEPFEFFFTDPTIYSNKNIASKILYEEYVRYHNNRIMREINGD